MKLLPVIAGDCSRRNFVKSMSAAGIGALIGTPAQGFQADAEPGKTLRVPTRPFGKTGDKVSILALGGDGVTANQLMMRQAVKWGVTFWDAWDSNRAYGGGVGRRELATILKNIRMTEKKYS